jgi:hypothetical protein
MNFGSAPSQAERLRAAMAARQQAETQRRTGLLPTQQPAPVQQAPRSPAPATSGGIFAPVQQAAGHIQQTLAARERQGYRVGTPLDSPAADLIRLAVGSRLVTPWDTEARYQEHATAYTDYQRIQEQHATHIQGGTFIIAGPQDQVKYQELQRAATRVETSGKAFEQTRDRELFGISRRVADLNKGAADFINLPKVSPAVEHVARTLLPKTSEEVLMGGAFDRLGNPAGARAPGIRDFQTGTVVGAYERFRTEPLTAAGSLAVGVAGGAVMKGATLLPKVGPVIASKGPAINKGVEVLYGGSVAARTGMAGPDYFEMGREFGGIMTTEAVPMYAGVKVFTAASPRVATGINRARGAYASYKIQDAPAAQVKGGHYPDNEMILEGMRMQESRSPFITARSLSRSRPGKSGRLVEVTTGNYVEKGRVDLFLRQFETPGQAQWRRPIPREFLAREDILAAPSHWRTPEFGGRFGRQDPVQAKLERKPNAGGHYPDNEMILEGMRMQESRSPFITARSLSRSRPGKSGRLVEVTTGNYVEKGRVDLFLRQFETPGQAQWRRPIPQEFLAREDILAAPSHWRTPEFGGPAAPVKVTKMYAGIPVSIGRRGLRVGKSTYSLSGRPLRVRPPRADLTLAEATKTRFAAPFAVGTKNRTAPGEMIISRLEPALSTRSMTSTRSSLNLKSSLLPRLDLNTDDLTKSALSLESSSILSSALRSSLDQDTLTLTTLRTTPRQRQRTDTLSRLREPAILLPRSSRQSFPLPKTAIPPAIFTLPGDPAPKKKRKKKGKKKEFDEFLALPDLSRLWRF